MAVNVEVHWIDQIEAQATKACADGEPSTANPYRFGSPAHRVWMLQYEKSDAARLPGTNGSGVGDE